MVTAHTQSCIYVYIIYTNIAHPVGHLCLHLPVWGSQITLDKYMRINNLRQGYKIIGSNSLTNQDGTFATVTDNIVVNCVGLLSSNRQPQPIRISETGMCRATN